MNIYGVVSDLIYHVEWEDWFSMAGHREDYRIVEMVRAKSPGQARWLAWQKRGNGDGPKGMPRMVVRLVERDAGGEPALLHDQGHERETVLWERFGAKPLPAWMTA